MNARLLRQLAQLQDVAFGIMPIADTLPIKLPLLVNEGYVMVGRRARERVLWGRGAPGAPIARAGRDASAQADARPQALPPRFQPPGSGNRADNDVALIVN